MYQIFFGEASKNIKTLNSKNAWDYALEDTKGFLYLNKEDINLIKSIGNMLGKTDVEGQVSEINITSDFIDTQINKAEEECKKTKRCIKV